MKDAARYLLIPYLLLVAARICLAWPLDVVVTPDELKFLGQARYLATGEDQVDPRMNLFYRVGYPLLITPAFLLGDDPAAAIKRVQILNAFLMSLIYPLAFALAGRLRDVSSIDRMLIALCVSVYPAAMLYSTTAMSANAFMPAFFLYALTAASALAHPRWWRWLACLAMAVGLTVIHERAVAIVGMTLATFAVYLLLAWRRQTPSATRAGPYLVAGLTTLLVGLGIWLSQSEMIAGTHLRDHLNVLLSGRRLIPIFVTLSGQLWYLGLATCGILVAGLLFGGLSRKSEGSLSSQGRWRVPPIYWLALLGSATSVFLVSVVYLSQAWERFTFRVYGRYNEGVLLPLLVVALLALQSAGKLRLRWLFSTLATLALLGGLGWILAQYWIPSMNILPHSFNASALTLHSELFGWGVLRSSAAAGVVLLLLGALFVYRWRWGVIALTLLFCLSTLATYYDTWLRRHDRIAGQQALIQRLRMIEPKPDTIYWDSRRRNGFNYLNVAYFLPEFDYQKLPGKVRRPTGQLVLSSQPKFSRNYPGARLIGLENLTIEPFIQGLWVLPGPLQDTLAERQWLFPKGFPIQFDDEALRARLRLAVPEPSQIRQDEYLTIGVEVDHQGTAPWPHRGGLATAAQWRRQTWDQEHSVGLLVRWYSDPTKPYAAQSWVNFPRTLYPGESIWQPVLLRAARGLEFLPPGKYRVTIQLAQVVKKWHHAPEQEPVTFDIQVTPRER